MSIILQFAAGDGLGAELIKWFSHGRYSHVDCVWPDGRLFGARVAGGVQWRPEGYLGSVPVKRVVLPLNEAQSTKFYDFLKAQHGLPYDKPSIVSFATGRDWRAPDSWFCSELQGAALEASGFLPGKLSTPSNKLTPADLMLVCSALTPVW